MRALTLLFNEVVIHAERAVGEFDWLGCRFLRYTPKQGPLRREVISEIESWLTSEGYRPGSDGAVEVTAEGRRVVVFYSNIVFPPESVGVNDATYIRLRGFVARIGPAPRLPWGPYYSQRTVEIRRT